MILDDDAVGPRIFSISTRYRRHRYRYRYYHRYHHRYHHRCHQHRIMMPLSAYLLIMTVSIILKEIYVREKEEGRLIQIET
jgi:Ni/Co efflux regulator RcnB